MYLSPAQYVIRVFGGVRQTARAIGRSPGAVSMWPKPRKNKGCDGNVPAAAQKVILKRARELKKDITPNDIIFGREVRGAGGR